MPNVLFQTIKKGVFSVFFQALFAGFKLQSFKKGIAMLLVANIFFQALNISVFLDSILGAPETAFATATKTAVQRLITAQPTNLLSGDTWYSGVRSIRSQTTGTGVAVVTTASGSYMPSAPSRFPTPFVLGTVGSTVQKFSLFNPYNVAVTNLDISATTGVSGVLFSTGGVTWSSDSLTASGFSISTDSLYVKTTSAVSSGSLSV